jgi:hypothetical protein
MRPAHVKWLRYLVAILLGNGLYFALSPYLPPAARHGARELDLGTVVDFWFCLLVYGLMELGAFLGGRRGGDHAR